MSLRRVIFWIHLIIGCSAGLVIFIMSVTGVLLAFERQCTSAADSSAKQVQISPGAQRLPLEMLLAKAAASEKAKPTIVTVRPEADQAIEIAFGRDRTVFIDPYTGEKAGAGGAKTRAFFNKIESWHRALGGALQPKGPGRLLTGACNLLFFFMCLSGMYLWWPRAWTPSRLKSTALFQGGINGKARDWNWHHVFGIWMVVPLLFITFTGVVMSYSWANDLLYRVTGNQPPAQTNRSNPQAPGTNAQDLRQPEPGKALDDLLSLAASRNPGWKSISFRPGNAPLTFSIDRGNGRQPALRTQVILNERTGEIVRSTSFAENNLGQKLRSWSRFVHTGEQFGFFGQLIAAFASLAGAMLVFTGMSLALRRLRDLAFQPKQQRVAVE